MDAGLNLHKHILNPDVQRIDVPHYKGLSLADILAEFPRPHDIYQYLPDDINEFNVNRQFVLDVRPLWPSLFQVINSRAPAKLKALVQKVVKERRDEIYNSDKSKIAILPAIKAAIERSQQVSSKDNFATHLNHSRERQSCPPPQADLEEAQEEERARGGEAGE